MHLNHCMKSNKLSDIVDILGNLIHLHYQMYFTILFVCNSTLRCLNKLEICVVNNYTNYQINFLSQIYPLSDI